MRYFNGFSLVGEEIFFEDKLIESDFAVAGFSYGAQQALEYLLAHQERVDRLILLSPAFFQDQKKSFIRAQLRYFKADPLAYATQFLENVAYPSSVELEPYLKLGTQAELDALLNYDWEPKKIEALAQRGVEIEVFIGAEDKIVNAKSSFEFFSSLSTTTYWIKGAGHLLV